MEQYQFNELINKIDELLAETDITNIQKKKLSKAKLLLLSPDKTDWVEGLRLLAKVITGTNSFINILENIWDWINNLF